MAKISKIWSAKENSWYDELRQVVPYREYQMDKIIQNQLAIVFPHFHAVRYTKTISKPGADTGSIPDFALVRRDYQEWWIVEVETIEDRLSHVKKQIADFEGGEYNSIVQAQYLKDEAPSLDLTKLKKLTQETPKILVIVDDINSSWRNALAAFKTLSICVFKVFRNGKGIQLYNIAGEYPYIYEDSSHCYFSDAMRNLLTLSNPDVLAPEIPPRQTARDMLRNAANWTLKQLGRSTGPSEKAGYVRIVYQGQFSIWERVVEGGNTYLLSRGGHPLSAHDKFVLRRVNDGTYLIELN